ncbi:MAG: hypothetical protein V1888_00965 [archaeon]
MAKEFFKDYKDKEKEFLSKPFHLYILDFNVSVGDIASENIPNWLKKKCIESFFDLSEDNTIGILSTNKKLDIGTLAHFSEYINYFYFLGKFK